MKIYVPITQSFVSSLRGIAGGLCRYQRIGLQTGPLALGSASPPLFHCKTLTQWSMSRSKGTSSLSKPSSKSHTRMQQSSHIICFHLTHTDVAFAFLSYPIDINIIPNPVSLVRFCPKLRTMPHIKGNPGTTAGTVHHCPGRKISSYVKLGSCRGKKEHGYCLTHQIPCLAPDCREKHWARLKNEPCTLCEQRRKVRLTEVKILLFCAETK